MDTHAIAARLDKVEANQTKVISEIKEMKETMQVVAGFLIYARAGIKVLYILGIAGKWLASIAIGVGALFALITFAKTGVPPKIYMD